MPQPAQTTSVQVGFASPPKSAAGSPPPAVPFTQCARAGRDCGEVIQVTGAGPLIEADPATGPYDGSASTLVGVVNSSSGTVSSLSITAGTGAFAFDGHGACSVFRSNRGCPYGPTGYEGPGTSFTNVSTDGTTGTVTFSKPLAPGKTAWFSLAQALAAQAVAGGGPSAAEQGGAPNPAEHQAACSQQPVNCATGAAWQEFTDFSLSGQGVPLLLTRTYVSADAGTSSPFGYGWTDSYAMRLVRGPGGSETVVQEDGATVTFQPSGAHGPNGAIGYTAPPRVLAWLTQTISKDGGVTYTFFRYGSRIYYSFSATGQLVSETDANGNVTQLTYNPDGTVQAVQDASGRDLKFSYSGGYVSRVTDPMGRAETYGYADGQLIWARNDIGDTWQFGYQPGTNLLTSIEDPRGYTETITYQGTQVASVSEPGLGTTDWSYSGNAAAPEGGTTTEQGPGQQGSPDGAITTYDYRALELTSVTAGTGTADAETTGYTYTTGTRGQDNARAGLVASQTDQELNVTTYGYDSYGNLTAVTNPLGNATLYQYGGNAGQWGEVTKVTMPGPGAPSESYQYDQQNGNLQQSTDGDGNTTSYTYTGTSDSSLTQIDGPNGQNVKLQYDSDGDVTSEAIASASGTDTTKYGYNGDGQVTCEAPPASVTAGVSCPSAPWGTPPHQSGTEAFSYNGAGQQISATNAQGGVTKTAYDQDGNTTAVTTPGHVVTAYGYNAADKETEQADGAPGAQPIVVATLAYYPDGELDYAAPGPVQTGAATGTSTGTASSSAAAPANVTTDGYDILGRLTSVTNPAGNVTGYSYGPDGELTAVTDPDQQVTSYGYNAAGELTGVRYSDTATPSVSYAYNPDGQPSAMTDGTGTTTFSYDKDGELTATRKGQGSSPGAGGYSYSYNAGGGSGTLTYPSGQQVTDSYDKAGQLVKVADWLGNTITFKYAPGGALSQENFPGGVQATDSSTKTGDQLDVTGGGATLASFADNRNSSGQLGSVATTGISGSPASVSYGYDVAGRLASAGQDQFGYDAAGDLTTPPGGSGQQFNAASELESGNGSSFAYNNEGDLTSAVVNGGEPQNRSYNQAGQLTSYQSGTTSENYGYNGEGLLASTSVNGFDTDYTWDLSQANPELLAAGSTSYIYGPDGQPVEQVTGSTATFLVADQQGNTRLLTSKLGTVVGNYSYGPYGTATYSCPSQQQAGCATTALLYGGQYTDGASGDSYIGGRYYNPATGQFLTPSTGASGTQAPYAFAADDPVNYSLTGLAWSPDVQGSGGGGSLWGIIGIIIVEIIIDILTNGDDDDDDGGGGSSSGSSVATTEDVEAEAAAETEAEAQTGSDAVQLSAAAEGDSGETVADVASDEDAAQSLTDEETDPVTDSQGAVDTEQEADDTQDEQASQSCWAVPGADASCRTTLVNQLKQGGVWNLVGFIQGSINAAQTCSDPHKSALDCAEKATVALATGLGFKKGNGGD